jgi:predicted GH43/DUF377 family glycosyl hydrolase
MDVGIAAALAGFSLTMGLFVLLLLVLLGFVALVIYWLFAFLWRPAHEEPTKEGQLERYRDNPVLAPIAEHAWESQAVFNPAAFVHEGKIHLLYRAVGEDGVSRIGYAVSDDGFHFMRRDTPAYDPSQESLKRAATGRGLPTQAGTLSYATLTYDTSTYGSGGGWGGSEDPRAVIIDGQVCMTFTSFEGWQNVRMMLSCLDLTDLSAGIFSWKKGIYLSPPGEVQKNWVLFPEKVRGKYVLLHNIYPTIEIAYFDQHQIQDGSYIKSRFNRHARPGKWDTWMRGAGAPPLKTKHGWLLLYHAVDEKEPQKYKVGALLLDLKDPKKVLGRLPHPILEPDAWYENDWKPGVVYASGAVIFGDDLIVYYGGGDKYIAAARMDLETLLHSMVPASDTALAPTQV